MLKLYAQIFLVLWASHFTVWVSQSIENLSFHRSSIMFMAPFTYRCFRVIFASFSFQKLASRSLENYFSHGQFVRCLGFKFWELEQLLKMTSVFVILLWLSVTYKVYIDTLMLISFVQTTEKCQFYQKRKEEKA